MLHSYLIATPACVIRYVDLTTDQSLGTSPPFNRIEVYGVVSFYIHTPF